MAARMNRAADAARLLSGSHLPIAPRISVRDVRRREAEEGFSEHDHRKGISLWEC